MTTVGSLTENSAATVRPMLASLRRHPFDSPDHLYELKWDGIRALARVEGSRTTLTDRNGRDITEMFPELSEIAVQGKRNGTVLDGEIVCMDKEGRPSFPLLQERLNHRNGRTRTDRANYRAQANYIVFDVLYLNGMPVMNEPLHRRKALLHQYLSSSEVVQPCAYIEREGKAFFHATCQLGLEGIVAKEKSSLYTPGKRSSAWEKVKRWRECEFTIGGYAFGGERGELFASLLLGLYNSQGALEYVGSVGAGFTKPQAKQVYSSLTNVHTDVCPFNVLPSMQKFLFWCKPELVCQVQYGEFSTDGKLRYPVYMTMREDKAPPECTLQDAPGWPEQLLYRA